MVLRKRPTHEMRVEFAQRVIDAYGHLLKTPPENRFPTWNVALLSPTHMFMNGVKVYIDEEEYHKQMTPSQWEFCDATPLVGRSLAREWGLVLPPGVRERGLLVSCLTEYYIPDRHVSEQWTYERDAENDFG